jgi:spoIIIJ-associated protein
VIGEGRTEEEAVARGLAKLGLRRDQVEVEEQGDRVSGLLSLFGFRRTRVRLVEKAAPPPRVERRDREDRRSRWDREDRGRRDRRTDNGRPPKREGRDGGGRRDGRSGERPDRKNQERFPRKDERRENRPTRREFPPKEAKAQLVKSETLRSAIPPEALLAQWRDLLGWEDLTWEIQPLDGRRVPVLLKTSRGEQLAGNGGRALEAFEYLFNLASSGGDREKPWLSFRLEGYPTTEEARLEDKALFAAFQVRRTGKPFKMDPMAPALRRLVHQTLANHPDVITASEGEGASRRVVVRPKAKE